MKNENNTLVKLFNAVGDPTRFTMISLIKDRPTICVSELAGEVGISPAGASQHLKVLESVGFLSPFRDGKKICYKVNSSDSNNAILKIIKESRT